MGLFSKPSNSTTPQQLNSISVDRSRYGDPIPLVYGLQRIPLTLLWYGAFTATAQTSSGSGKGSGGSNITGYNYTASCVMGLCEGPIQGIFQVWKDKVITTIQNELLTGPFLGAGGQAIWTYLTSNFPTQAVPYDHTAYVGAINLNLGSSAALPNYTFEVQGFLSAQSPVYVTASGGSVPAGATSFTISGTSAVADGIWDITFSDYETRTATQVTTGGVSTMSWDTTNPLINQSYPTILVGGWDAEPSAIIIDYCTDPNHGANYSYLNQSQITGHTWTSGGTTYYDNYKTYCIANGLYISPWEDTQRAASDFLKDLLQITNSNAVVSAGQMKIIPYGDNIVSGNGVTYTPNLQPLFSFTDDDYVQAGSNNIDDPVAMTRKPLTQTFNVVRVEFFDRGNAYNASLAEWTDPLDIAVNGIRVMGTLTLHQITQTSVALKVAALIGQRQLYVRNQYSFSVRNDAYTLLEPMDLISITDSNLGINDLLCRVVTVEDDKDDTFTITCEDMLIGTASAPLYNFQPAQGYQANFGVLPPSVATPVIFTAPPALVGQGGGFELWIAVGPTAPTGSQTSSYGGCNISASGDDLTWTSVGQAIGSARFGTVTSNIASTDTTINLTMNAESYNLDYFLQSASAADFAANRALLYVDGEIMGFQTVTLVSAGNYTVTVSRGLFGTTAAAHLASSLWARLDQSIVKMPIDPGMIGQTIYFEFETFNSTGHEVSTPTTYSLVIQNTGGFVGLTPLTNQSGTTIVGNQVFKSATTFAWDSSFASVQSFTNGCSASCYPAQTLLNCAMGLTRNPAASNSYTNLAYGWYFQGGVGSGTLYIFEAGTSIGAFGSYSTNDFFQITHDGKHVCYYHNGTLIRSVVDATDTFYMQGCFEASQAALYGIEFTSVATAVTPFTLVAMTNGVAVSGTRAAGNSFPTTAGWGLRCFQSQQSFANGVALSASTLTAGGDQYFGLSTNPTVTTTGNSVLAGWNIDGTAGAVYMLYNGATFGGAQAAWSAGDVYEVTYDLFNFRWYRNGTLIAQQADSGVGPLYLFGDFYGASMCFEEITIQASGAATPVLWTSRGNATVGDSYATKNGGSAAWDSDIFSIASYATCNIVFKANETTGAFIVGLATVQPTSVSNGECAYGLYLTSGGSIYRQVGSTTGALLGTYAITDRFAITYDGTTITYYQNGVSIGTNSVSGATYYAAAIFYTPGAGINSLDFGPGTTVPIIDTSAINVAAATGVLTFSDSSTISVPNSDSSIPGATITVPAPLDGNSVLYTTATFVVVESSGDTGNAGFAVQLTEYQYGHSNVNGSELYYGDFGTGGDSPSNGQPIPIVLTLTTPLYQGIAANISINVVFGNPGYSLSVSNLSMQAQVIKR